MICEVRDLFRTRAFFLAGCRHSSDSMRSAKAWIPFFLQSHNLKNVTIKSMYNIYIYDYIYICIIVRPKEIRDSCSLFLVGFVGSIFLNHDDLRALRRLPRPHAESKNSRHAGLWMLKWVDEHPCSIPAICSCCSFRSFQIEMWKPLGGLWSTAQQDAGPRTHRQDDQMIPFSKLENHGSTRDNQGHQQPRGGARPDEGGGGGPENHGDKLSRGVGGSQL